MLKLVVKSSIEKACDLIDNRLTLELASKNINPGGSASRLSLKGIVQSIGGAIHYTEKTESRAALVICTALKRGAKSEAHRHGLAIRPGPDGTLAIYIDSYARAIERGILSPATTSRLSRLLLYGCSVLFLVAALFTPIGWFVTAILLVGSPILIPLVHRRAKQQFERDQGIMHSILDGFESELPVVERADTKDWITLWGRVKSSAEDILIPA